MVRILSLLYDGAYYYNVGVFFFSFFLFLSLPPSLTHTRMGDTRVRAHTYERLMSSLFWEKYEYFPGMLYKMFLSLSMEQTYFIFTWYYVGYVVGSCSTFSAVI